MRKLIFLSVICLTVSCVQNASAKNFFKRVAREVARTPNNVNKLLSKGGDANMQYNDGNFGNTNENDKVLDELEKAQQTKDDMNATATAFSGAKRITLCGERLDVPAIFYAACFAISATLPANCTGGAAVTAGTSCYAAVSAMSIVCGVSVATLLKVAKSCIEDDE